MKEVLSFAIGAFVTLQAVDMTRPWFIPALIFVLLGVVMSCSTND